MKQKSLKIILCWREDNSLNEMVQTPAKRIPITQNTEQDKYFGREVFFQAILKIFQHSLNESVDPNHLVPPGDEATRCSGVKPSFIKIYSFKEMVIFFFLM